MDELTSTEFRKRYARLTSPTKVMVNGHVIGLWVPTDAASPASMRGHEMLSAVKIDYPSTQAKRDDLLRKINRKENR